MTGEDVTHLCGLTPPLGGEFQCGHIGLARKRHFLDRFQLETGLRHQIMLKSDCSAHDRDIRIRFQGTNHLGHGEKWIDMAGGAAASQNDMLPSAHSV